MQRTIILMRHAKANWPSPMQSDFDRTLHTRGLHDAPMMGQRLAKRGMEVNAIISSTAVRAKQTAELVAQALSQKIIEYKPELYHASPSTISEVIYSLDKNLQTVLIVCHNPGITDWVNQQCGVITGNMPAASFAAFTFESDYWHNFDAASKKLLFFDFPKSAG
jgi:phosphohistidine phosphatase